MDGFLLEAILQNMKWVIDNSTFQNGHSCAYIKSKAPKENEFGTLMQTLKLKFIKVKDYCYLVI